MLSRLRKKGPAPDPTSVNYTTEHVSLAKTLGRRRWLLDKLDERIPLIRLCMVAVSVIWILALPHGSLWKRTYVDENAISPGQVSMYFDWSNVHQADRYLDHLEKIVNGTFEERSNYLQETFSFVGLNTGNTSMATYAHIQPPRSAGTETILLSANWISRDGTPNLRGVATAMALGEFLKGQTYWAFDIVLVIGEGYVEGLNEFMGSYHSLFSGIVWTALNLDYPGHSFSHLGLFYEGVNGRLPNQDVFNTISHIARYSGGIQTRVHDIDYEPDWQYPQFIKDYLLAAKHFGHHFYYNALGKPSGAHGVLARHRIDSMTMYCTPATGPHGFHTLGRTVESTLRSLNNLLERLHASYFFYLVPMPHFFIPVGNYLPAAILLGASVTIGGFDCPCPLEGVLWMVPAFFISWIAWMVQMPLISLLAIGLPRPKGEARKSAMALTHLLYGALIPTLAMINFPQALLLGSITVLYLMPPRYIRWGILALHPYFVKLPQLGLNLRWEWETIGNLAWPGVFAVWLPLWILSSML